MNPEFSLVRQEISVAALFLNCQPTVPLFWVFAHSFEVALNGLFKEKVASPFCTPWIDSGGGDRRSFLHIPCRVPLRHPHALRRPDATLWPLLDPGLG